MEFIASEAEYRVHVFRGGIILAQRKVPKEDAHEFIRTRSHGWTLNRFAPVDLTSPLYCASVRAVEILGLDFGAVDVLKRGRRDYVVLEVNTAPGLSEETVGCYAERMLRWWNEA